MKNGVYEPLKSKVKDYVSRITTFEDNFENQCDRLVEAREKLVDSDCNYMYQSKAMSNVVSKIGFNSKLQSEVFFDSELFSSLNSKMKNVDKRAKDLTLKTDNINKIIDEYKENITENVKELETMENERLQSILDSLYQINVYQTNCDMNNKYDANNFNEVIDNVDTKDCSQEFAKLCNDKELFYIDTYNFKPFDELISEDDVVMDKISEDKEKALSQKVEYFINQCRTQIEEEKEPSLEKPDSKLSSFSEEDKTKFTELMNEKINRYNFIKTLTKCENTALSKKEDFEKFSILIKIFLKCCDRKEDSDYLKSILTISNKFFYDIEEDDAVIRTYITEGIRDNKIWDNYNLWGKAIFKDFRDIMRKFKIPKEHENDLDKDDILRNVLFNRLMFYIDKLTYFDMKPKHLRVISKRFMKEYKFTSLQKETLNGKVVVDEFEEQQKQQENEPRKARRSITKSVTKWMTQLEKFGVSAVNHMKTYVKKKEVDEEPVPDLNDGELDCESENHKSDKSNQASPCKQDDNEEKNNEKDQEFDVKQEELNLQKDSEVESKDSDLVPSSTDTSNNSEGTPTKEDMNFANKEVEINDLITQEKEQ